MDADSDSDHWEDPSADGLGTSSATPYASSTCSSLRSELEEAERSGVIGRRDGANLGDIRRVVRDTGLHDHGAQGRCTCAPSPNWIREECPSKGHGDLRVASSSSNHKMAEFISGDSSPREGAICDDGPMNGPMLCQKCRGSFAFPRDRAKPFRSYSVDELEVAPSSVPPVTTGGTGDSATGGTHDWATPRDRNIPVRASGDAKSLVDNQRHLVQCLGELREGLRSLTWDIERIKLDFLINSRTARSTFLYDL